MKYDKISNEELIDRYNALHYDINADDYQAQISKRVNAGTLKVRQSLKGLEIDKYQPNGTPEEIKLNILHSVADYYISNEGTEANPNYHVWVQGITCASSDSAYNDLSFAIARCNYLANRNLTIHQFKNKSHEIVQHKKIY